MRGFNTFVFLLLVMTWYMPQSLLTVASLSVAQPGTFFE